MNILLIRKFTNLDGTHTLFLRTARELRAMGHGVYFLLFPESEGPLSEEMSAYATLLPQASLRRGAALPRIDVIHGIMEGDLLWWAYWYLKNVLFPEAKIVIGFYHPRVFWEPPFPIPSPDKVFYRWFFSRIPAQNLLFMNEQVKRSHEIYFERDFSGSAVIPLPVTVPQTPPAQRSVSKHKIVSVGRLVDFKNYVEYLVDVIKSLRAKGLDVELHVYGDGLLRKRIDAKIEAAGMREHILLKGEIAYARLPEVLSDAFLFIGMGTAVIEASGMGIPSLLAVESNEEATCYGWFCDHEGYHVGEQVDGWERTSMETLIESAYAMDAPAYARLSERSWEKARVFAARDLMEAYCRFISAADASFTIKMGPWRRRLMRLSRQPFKLVRHFYNRTRYAQN